MKRILHVVGCMDRAGAETFIMNCYRQIDRSAVQFDFVVISGTQGAYDAEIEHMGGRIHHISRPKLTNPAPFLRQLRQIIIQHGPYSAVHSHIYFLSGLVMYSARRAEVPVRIAHSHSTQDGRADNILRTLYRSWMRVLIRRHATELLGCSAEACEQLFGTGSMGYPSARVLRNGIAIPQPVSVESRKDVREELGVQESGIVLGHVGRFEHPKNQFFLIEILQTLLKADASAKVIFVGDGSQRSKVEKQVDRLGLSRSVVFTGVRDDVNRILAAFDVFVFPSLYEGLGLAVIEAQALGIPCVISDAIPPEVDIGLGLVERVSLRAGVGAWLEAIGRAAGRQHRTDAVSRAEALGRSGYDITSVIQTLCQIYGHEKVSGSNMEVTRGKELINNLAENV